MLQLLAELTYNDKTLRKRKAENLRPKGIQYAKTSSTKLADGDDVREVTETELVNLVEWANTLPLFEHLSHEDRQMLLKKSAVYHLILEHCYYTAQTEQNDLLFYANGSFVPRATKVLPEDSKRDISKERSWRLDCLYGKSTGQCLDHVAAPLRRLKLLPEELVVLKILMLLSCGEVMGTANVGADLTSADDRIKLLECRNRIVAALFHFYESMNVKNSAERFGNVLLSISGIVACSPVALESYQMARLLKYVVFDETAEQLLFNNS
ncbi:Nuclear hormone receptor family member nhr-19 [Aphelenchoides avenae]|nr:Nuclear hormone receptor family member nhr-19 [Aphelenchus avenae]